MLIAIIRYEREEDMKRLVFCLLVLSSTAIPMRFVFEEEGEAQNNWYNNYYSLQHPFIKAVVDNNIGKVRTVLAQHPKYITLKDSNNYTALYLVLNGVRGPSSEQRERFPMIKLLLEKGANPYLKEGYYQRNAFDIVEAWQPNPRDPFYQDEMQIIELVKSYKKTEKIL